MSNIIWLCYLGFLALAAIGILIKVSYKTRLGRIDFLISIITWVGLFGYVNNIHFLTTLIWKFVFIFGLLWDAIFSFKKFNEETNDEDDEPHAIKLAIFIITSIILLGPLYYGLFNYAFK